MNNNILQISKMIEIPLKYLKIIQIPTKQWKYPLTMQIDYMNLEFPVLNSLLVDINKSEHCVVMLILK